MNNASTDHAAGEYDGIYSLIEAADSRFTKRIFKKDKNNGKGALRLGNKRKGEGWRCGTFFPPLGGLYKDAVLRPGKDEDYYREVRHRHLGSAARLSSHARPFHLRVAS